MGIMDDIMPLPEPSQAIIDAIQKKSEFDYRRQCAAVEAWEDLLASTSIGAGSFVLHREGPSSLFQGNLMEIHLCLDPFADSHEHLMLAAFFRKGGAACIDDWFFSGERKEKEPALYERYAEFFGFEGTWEQVGLKIVELNDLIVAENTPPPIPDDLE